MDGAFEVLQAYGSIAGIFDEDYDGGEFCKGLLAAKEAAFVFKKVTKMQSQATNQNSGNGNAEAKRNSLEDRFNNNRY